MWGSYSAEYFQEKIDGLEADLASAVEVAYNHGATEWVRLNYPDYFYRRRAMEPKKDKEKKS